MAGDRAGAGCNRGKVCKKSVRRAAEAAEGFVCEGHEAIRTESGSRIMVPFLPIPGESGRPVGSGGGGTEGPGTGMSDGNVANDDLCGKVRKNVAAGGNFAAGSCVIRSTLRTRQQAVGTGNGDSMISLLPGDFIS